MWGGGACGLPFVARMSQARRKHGAGTRRGTCPSAGGGGVAVWLPSSPFLPYVRTPGGPPVGACTARARYGHGRVVRPTPSLRYLLTLPLCPRGGGGGAFRPPPYLHPPPLGGRRCVCGGGGALVVFPSLHACPRHDASTTQARGEPLGCSSGGGVSPLGLSALLHGIGSAPQDLQPLLPLGGSRHVSARCSVSRACSLMCPYLLEQVRTRVETDDEEVRAAGRTYRTPRCVLRHPPPWSRGGPLFRHPTARGGLTAHPLLACVSTSERPDTGAVVSIRWKWRLQSGRALSSPGSLPPPSAMEAPEVLWQRRGETGGGFICGIPWPSS